jgi:DNA-binding SARP family transcriptional activator
MRIELLGGFRVAVRGRAVPDDAWTRRRPAAVIKLLALAPRHRLHRERVMDVLWPGLAPDAAAANLRKAPHHARRALDPADGARLIPSIGELLSLADPDIDVDAFRVAASNARPTGPGGPVGSADDGTSSSCERPRRAS